MADAPWVFFTYSHDSDEHAARVLALADALCDDGIDVTLDRYVHPAPEEGWPRWMERNLDEAEFVLMVCTATYRRRVMGREEPGKGLGVHWEGNLIYNRIYHDQPSGSRFIPILLPGSEPAHIPNPVQGHAYYRIATFDLTDPGFEALYRHLTDQPATPRPHRGPITILPPRPRPRPSPSPLPPMRTPLVLLRAIGKAVQTVMGPAGVLGGIVIDTVVAEIANNVWDAWGKGKSGEEHRAELEAVAQATGEEICEGIEEIVQEIAAAEPANVRQALAGYLRQVPASIRRRLRRPADPSGTTVPPGLVPRKGEDLLPFLPARLPLFQPGDRPLPGVDWVLDELLGVGGFGEVWKAHNPHVEGFAPVALKFCIDPQARQRLLQHEAEVCAQVMRQGRHPGFVTLQATYLDADPPCLEYEYIEGGDLAGLIQEWHRQTPKPTPEQAAKVVLRLSEIVGFAHRLNPPIVHRDLKPSNILLQRVEGVTQFKIADFGIGGVAISQVIKATNRGTSVGAFMTSAVRGSYTPSYASPEQMRGSPPDPRDDVHALGVIWYQILTGDLARGRPGGKGWRTRLVDQGMGLELLNLLESCFEDHPADRPADAADLAEKLRKHLILDAQPTSSSSGATSSPAETMERQIPAFFKTRSPLHRWLLCGAIVVALALLLAILIPIRNAPPETGKTLLAPPETKTASAPPETRPLTSAEESYHRGRECLDKKDWDQAINHYTEAIRLDPNYAAAYHNRGAAWNAKAEYDKAIADYTEAIRLDPKFALMYSNRGYAWNAKAEYDKAIADCTEAIRLDPKSAFAYNNRGAAWNAKAEYDKAIADYTEAIRLGPKDAAAYHNRASVYERVGDHTRAEVDRAEAERLRGR